MNTRPLNIVLYQGLLMLMLMISSGLFPQAYAYETTISAEYQPGGDGKFVFTSPNEGLCATWAGYCGDYGERSLAPPLTVQWDSVAASAPERERVAIKVPSASRTLTLTNTANSRKLNIPFRVTTQWISIMYPPNANASLADMWGTIGGTEAPQRPTNCQTSGLAYSNTYIRPIWIHPATSNALCSIPNTKPVPGPLTGRDFSFIYHLNFPSTATLHSGEYRGKLEFTVGPHGDFDFGDKAQVSLNKITLNFIITIKPIFNVQFASNTMDVQLAPPGGWSGWIDHGVRPDVLRAEIPFFLTTSVPIVLKVKCQHTGGAGTSSMCALRRRGITNNYIINRAPIRMKLDIPGMRDHRGIAAHDLGAFTFSSSEANSYWQLYPYSYVQNARSRITLEVLTRANSQHADMLAFPGQTFEGRVTLIFEAQLE